MKLGFTLEINEISINECFTLICGSKRPRLCSVLCATGEQSSLHPHHSASHEDPQVQGGGCQRQCQNVAHDH